MTHATNEPTKDGPDISNDSGIAACSSHEINVHTLHRREFFRRVALASGSALVANVVGARRADAAALEAMTSEALSALAPDCPPDCLCDDPSKVLEISLFVYGGFTCRELFTSKFEHLIPQVKVRVDAAVTEGLLTQVDAAFVSVQLDELATIAPKVTVKKLFKLDKDVKNIDKIRSLCALIDCKGIALPFAFQEDQFTDEADAALHSVNTDSMIHPQTLGNLTLSQVYKEPLPPNPNDAKIKAITHAKKGLIFGPKRAAFQDESDYLAYMGNSYDGVPKGNNLACSGGTCVFCSDDGSFCEIIDNECSLVSDPWTTQCTQ